MTKELAMPESEQVSHLSEEIVAIITVARENAGIEIMRAKYDIGEAIVKNPLFKRHAKTQGALLARLSEETGQREGILYDCVRFYETYPDQNSTRLVGKLVVEHRTWTNVRRLIYGDVSLQNETTPGPICRKCSAHYPRQCP